MAGSVDAIMITLQADFNHFLDGDDMVRGELMREPELGWLGRVDWSTQDVWESYPPVVAVRR